MPPRLTPSELLEQWARANEYSWTTEVVKCSSCSGDFSTGDLFFSFPAEDLAEATPASVAKHARPAFTGMVRYFCVRCSEEAIGAGQVFDGAGVFVERKHQHRTFEELPGRMQDLLLQAFTLLDQLHANLKAAVSGRPPPEPS
jgi:hypothetical protein